MSGINGKAPVMLGQPRAVNVPVDIKLCEPIPCPHCGHLYFRQVKRFFHISRLVNKMLTTDFNGPVEVIVCDKCGEERDPLAVIKLQVLV